MSESNELSTEERALLKSLVKKNDKFEEIKNKVLITVLSVGAISLVTFVGGAIWFAFKKAVNS